MAAVVPTITASDRQKNIVRCIRGAIHLR